MRAVAPGAVFVSVPAVSFVPFPPPEDEPPPAAPSLAGPAVDGRIGSVAGERRATVWCSTDPAVFATAEDLEGSLAGLASSRAGGAPAGPVELVDRVVFAADGGEDGSARAFRHGNVAVLVEGADPADLDDRRKRVDHRPRPTLTRQLAARRFRCGFSWTSSISVPKLPWVHEGHRRTPAARSRCLVDRCGAGRLHRFGAAAQSSTR